jgi:hypothetical protein
MKLNRITLGAVLLTSTAFAQSNTFPASGNVGIGTTTPESHLHIKHAGGSTLLLDEPGGVKYSVSSRWGGYFTIWDETNPSFGAFPRFAINPGSGGVGIGTLFPYASLEVTVKSPYGLIGNNNTIALRNRDTTPWNATSIINYDASNTWNANAAIDFLNHNHAGATGAASIRFYTKKTDAALMEVMHIAPSGNVGIGTSSPAEKLHVVGNFLLNGSMLLRGGGQLQLQFRNSDSAPNQRFSEIIEQNGRITFRTVNDAYSEAYDWMKVTRKADTYGVQSVSFPSNVGIGETNPQHKLAVNGTIKAKEIIVETTG